MTVIRRDATECSKRPRSRIAQFLVALPPVLDLLLSAKHLFVAAILAIASVGGVKDALFSREFWTGPGFVPTAQGGLSRLAIARLKSAGVPLVPVLRRVDLTPELIAELEERLSV